MFELTSGFSLFLWLIDGKEKQHGIKQKLYTGRSRN